MIGGNLKSGVLLNNTYRIEELIGDGGTGYVYRANNIASGEKVAIKVLLPHLSNDEQFIDSMRRECHLLRDIVHPNVVRYYTFQRTHDFSCRYFLVMQLIEGRSLAQVMARHGPVDPALLLKVARGVLEGLKACHEGGIIHRDVSPDNIILREDDPTRATLIDFGIAGHVNLGAKTVIGAAFAGKYQYAAPEQLNGIVDVRSDIFSLGMTLLAAARGEGPTCATTFVTEFGEIKHSQVDTSDVPEPLRGLVTPMLRLRPDDRPQNTSELLWTLESNAPKQSASSRDFDELRDLLDENFSPRSDETQTNRSTPKKFSKGQALFNPPSKMWTGVVETVGLRLKAGDVFSEEERLAVERTMVGKGEITERPVEKIGVKMKAVLHYDEDFFHLGELSSKIQDVSFSSVTHWDWSLKPKISGETVLTLRLTVLEDLEGKSLQSDLEALRAVVNIKVHSVWALPVRFWQQNWKWIIGFIVGVPSVITAWLSLLK